MKKRLKKLLVMMLLALGGSLEAQVVTLFSDSFDRADSADINLNSAANQAGAIAPLIYSSFSNNTATSSSISGNKALLSVDGAGQVRLVPQGNIAEGSALLSRPGGSFEISYTVDAGVDYGGSVHGGYSSSLILSQESILENPSAGLGNPWHGLFVTIYGDGKVKVYSQGVSLLNLVVQDWGTPELVASVTNGLGIGAHDVRLVVDTDGFGTTTTNTFTLYINNILVGSDDFNWKSSDNLSLGLEAANYSARFDNLHIQVVPFFQEAIPIGQWEPFWRAAPVMGEWIGNGITGEVVNEYQKRNSFCVQTKPFSPEIPFADHLNVVRLIGGWKEGFGFEKPVPADEADLVYKDEFGALQYRWDKLALRLDPYINAGYTNLTLVLDNIPYCFTTNHVNVNYGQVGAPDDFNEWHTFVFNLCVALVDLYGFETANQFRFRQGTEAQSEDRFAGTQEDYFKIYDHSAAAVKSVLPGAEFGPFNAAGGINSNYNVPIAELARHCATGTNYATGEVGSPFDFIPTSFYLANSNQTKYSAASRVENAVDTFETIQAELPEEKPYEIHEFGILTCEAGLSTDEPGARGAAWTFQVMAGLRENGLSRLYHWDISDTIRSTQTGLHKLLKSTGWLLSVLDRTAGGDAYVLDSSLTAEPDTDVKTIGVFGGDRDWIMTSAYNPDRLNHSKETISIHVPTNLLQIAEGDVVLWTSLSQTNSAHWMIRRDLEEQGMLNSDFANVPEQLSFMRTMTTNTTTSAEQDYLAGRFDIYEQAVIDSLTLKPFPGTVVTNGTELIFTLEMTPPETAVICIGRDRTAGGTPYAWLDSFGLATNGYVAAAAADVDADGFTAAQEYIQGTDPLVVALVPDVTGLSQSAAEAAITNVGLTVGSVTAVYSATVSVGNVIGQSVAAGSDVTANSSSVDLQISLGNDTPIADVQNVAVNEDGSVAITLTGSDIDGDPLTYAVVTQPANGNLSGTAPNLTYTPNADFNGTDSFTFTVNDGAVDSLSVTVSITVSAVNDAPVFAVDPINVVNATEDIAYVGSVPNATDAEGDTLTYSKLTCPAWLSVATDGSLSGTPLDGDVGSNSFTVQVDDGNGGTDTATLNITVDEFMEAVLAASGVQTLGTMSGTLADTYASDDVYQVLTESGDPSALEHEWTFNVRVGELVTFYVEAYHTANREGDDFVFAYSTNGTDYIEMGIVIDTVDDDTMVWYALPRGTSGTVTVRVLDTDRTGGNTAADSLYVDEIYIVSEDSTVAPAAANTPVPASGTVDVAIDQNLAWTAGAMTVSHDVYFGTTPGAPELQGNQSGIIFDPGVLAYSTTYYWAIDEVNHTGTTAGPVWSFTTVPPAGPAIVPITSITTTSSGTPEQIILNSFTAGGILYTTATDLVTGTSEKTDGSALKGRVIGDQDNFDLNLYFTRGGNPSDNSWDTISFGGENWSNSNGDDADFFIFESVGNDSVSIRPIFTDGSVGQFVVFSVKGGDSTNWGDTNVPITEGARSGQNIFGMAFAITDLVDAAGVALTNSTVIMGLDFDAPGADIASISAVAVP